MTRTLVLPMLAAAMWSSAVPARAADPDAGARTYRQHCAHCHGPGGRPVLPSAPDLTQPTALLKPDLTLLGLVKAGRGTMPAYAGLLREREILDVVAFLRTLR